MNPLARHTKDHAVAVLIIGPGGRIPLVRDPKKGPKLYWKAPGGRNKAGEVVLDTAIREVKEETGVSLSEKDLQFVCSKDLGSHVLSLFVAIVDSLAGIKARGEKGEEVKVFLRHEVFALQDFFRNHRDVFAPYLLKNNRQP